MSSPEGEDVELTINSTKVYERLAVRIAALETENAQLNVMLEVLGDALSSARKRVNELEGATKGA